MYITREDESEAIIEHYERKIDSLSEEIAKLNARIAELKAWKAAVPVGAIHSLWEEVAYQSVVDELEDDISAVKQFIDAQVKP